MDAILEKLKLMEDDRSYGSRSSVYKDFLVKDYKYAKPKAVSCNQG